MIVGLPGMGKTTCIVNLCAQLAAGGITPLIFSYHDDLEAKLGERLGALRFVNVDGGLGFNPMQVTGSGPHAWIDSVGMLRDVFASIYPDLGDLQTHEIREAIKQSYQEKGYGAVEQSPVDLPPPEFQRFFDLLRRKPRPNPGLMARLEELNDYGFFRNTDDRASLLESREATVVRLHRTQNEVIQNAMASFVLLNVYQSMFLRGAQPGLTHAVVLDEAHRASRLKLLPTMAKECRKFGLALLVASQEAKDFSPSLYAAVANYLVLRVTDADANALAKNVVESTEAPRLAGRLKQLDPYCAMFVSARRRPTYLSLEG
jgi:DNA phosphorothioation-dependent restriction protein DptH